MVNDWICLFRNSWHRRSRGQEPQKARSHNRESRPKDRGQAGDPRKASHLILVFILVCCENFIFHPRNTFELSQGNLLLSLNVKSWPENWNEIPGFKDWNLSELVDLSRDGGVGLGQGGHYHDALDNGRNAGGQVCNQITNCCAELQFKLLISQRLTLCENTNYNRQLMFSLKSNRQSFFINIFLRHVKLCSFVRTWNWKLGIKFDLFSPALHRLTQLFSDDQHEARQGVSCQEGFSVLRSQSSSASSLALCSRQSASQPRPRAGGGRRETQHHSQREVTLQIQTEESGDTSHPTLFLSLGFCLS